MWIMIWLILAVLIVGYFIVSAIEKNNISEPVVPKLLPINQRIKMLTELSQNLQSFLGDEYKKELADYKKLRYNKHEKYDWITWDRERETQLDIIYSSYCSLVELNSVICQRLGKDDQRLLEHLTDWGVLLEQKRDKHMSHAGFNDYIAVGLEPPTDDVVEAERNGVMSETFTRIISRAKELGVPNSKIKNIKYI